VTQSSRLYRRGKPLRDIVAEHVRAEIYRGTFRPGTRLVERELAEAFDVSRLPVREALRALQNDGLVEYLPTRGLAVRRLDRSQVGDLCDIREALEVLAARQAAERVAAGTEQHLLETVQEADEALVRGDITAAHVANSRLHDQIAVLSGNAHLVEMLGRVVGRVAWLQRRMQDVDLIRNEHRALAEAIASGDSERASAASREHLLASRARIITLLADR